MFVNPASFASKFRPALTSLETLLQSQKFSAASSHFPAGRYGQRIGGGILVHEQMTGEEICQSFLQNWPDATTDVYDLKVAVTPMAEGLGLFWTGNTHAPSPGL